MVMFRTFATDVPWESPLGEASLAKEARLFNEYLGSVKYVLALMVATLGGTAAIMHNIKAAELRDKDIEKAAELREKDIELKIKDEHIKTMENFNKVESESLRNVLLYGQSKEYKDMREAQIKAEMEFSKEHAKKNMDTSARGGD